MSVRVASAAAGVLAGARSLTAITEWISDVPVWACRIPGFPTDRSLAPCPSRATSAGPGLRAIAVDGKALRGSRTSVTGDVALLAVTDHTGHVPAQRQAADKSNEIPAFRLLLHSVDLTSTVITADAPHTQHAHGTYLRERGAHYIAQVNANHPGLFHASATCPGARSRSAATTVPGPATA
ncbi:transposase [Streptomyces sp. NPDC002265]|uniref:transposase n=1 Tax=Streptomyces sp. NPDC002265 TaxID=3154415 RepID=UPI0033326FE9